MNTFFIADTHFGHAHIIELCKRPFATVEEMNDCLVDNSNALVGPRDLVYNEADFSFSKPGPYLDQLNGQIFLITCNHDRKRLNEAAKRRFAAVTPFAEVTVNNQEITLCHYALRVWNKSHHGTWHLYGHSHGSLADDPHALILDVGVDCWWWRSWEPATTKARSTGALRSDFRPLSFEEISILMSKKRFRPVDHHDRPDL